MDAQTLLSRIGETLSVRRAFGDPIEQNGIIVIPVAFVAGGGGGGEGPVAPPAGSQKGADDVQSSADSAEDASPKMGSGGGLGGVIVPLGVYVVKGDDVKWKPVMQPMLVTLPVLGLLRLLVKRRSRALSSKR